MILHDAAPQPPSVETPEPAPESVVARAEMDAGFGIPFEDVLAWVSSWDTDHELPKPMTRKLD